jgi:hypothetical protein
LEFNVAQNAVGGQVNAMEKSYPHRPYADGGTIKRGFTKEMSNVLNSQVDLCKPDAKKKPPLASPATRANGGNK